MIIPCNQDLPFCIFLVTLPLNHLTGVFFQQLSRSLHIKRVHCIPVVAIQVPEAEVKHTSHSTQSFLFIHPNIAFVSWTHDHDACLYSADEPLCFSDSMFLRPPCSFIYRHATIMDFFIFCSYLVYQSTVSEIQGRF